MAADLGLVADAAERDPDELPAHRAGDGLAERGLADAGRADQGQHGAAAPAADDAEAASARRLRTARYSVMRSFTSSRPAWSASRTARAPAMS